MFTLPQWNCHVQGMTFKSGFSWLLASRKCALNNFQWLNWLISWYLSSFKTLNQIWSKRELCNIPLFVEETAQNNVYYSIRYSICPQVCEKV